MICRGGFHPTDADLIPGDVETCILVGNAGAQFWRSFSAERPAGSDPVEAWTKRVLEQISADLGAESWPFVGPPFLPFLEWAKRSDPVTESPVGPLIHPVYGLWHAYRGMLLFREKIDLPEIPSRTSRCPRPVNLRNLRRPALSAGLSGKRSQRKNFRCCSMRRLC